MMMMLAVNADSDGGE